MAGVGMWRRARVMLCALVFMLGGMSIAGAQDAPIRVPILAYHNVDYSGSDYSVTPDQLDAQLSWLIQNGYTVVTLGQYWDAVVNGGWLPANPVVLTDDDGWQSAMTFADVLGKYGMIGTYFINNVSSLTADQIYALSLRGSVQAHTVTHAHLAAMDYAAQYAEVADNMAYLTQITGQPVRFLAWPFGERNASAIQAAADAGIVAAFGLGGTCAYTSAPLPYQIPRIMIRPWDDLDSFAAKVTAG